MKCSQCNTERQTKPTAKCGDRVPKGWKRRGEAVYCDSCWKSQYILRAVTFPVLGPADIEWSELRTLLSSCWAQSTGMANWTVTELAKNDVLRNPDDEKMPAMPKVYLYPAARKRFPEMDPTSVVSVLNAVEGKYRKLRLEVIWRSAATLPRHRYPVPYPLHNQSWSAAYSDEGRPVVSVRLGGKRITLRLKDGKTMYRQLKSFGQIVSGEAVQGEMAIYRVRASNGDHRSGTESKTPGGGQTVSHRVMAKLVAWLPRREQVNGHDIMKLRTGSDRFWTAVVGEREPWILNADWVKQWVTEHRRFLDRISEDTKFEKRWPKRKRLQFNEYRERRCDRQHNRLKTFVQQSVSMLVKYAERQQVGELHYDDTDKSYLREFPWCQVEQQLKTKCDEVGIVFARANVADEDNSKSETE